MKTKKYPSLLEDRLVIQRDLELLKLSAGRVTQLTNNKNGNTRIYVVRGKIQLNLSDMILDNSMILKRGDSCIIKRYVFYRIDGICKKNEVIISYL